MIFEIVELNVFQIKASIKKGRRKIVDARNKGEK